MIHVLIHLYMVILVYSVHTQNAKFMTEKKINTRGQQFTRNLSKSIICLYIKMATRLYNKA